MPDLVDCVRLAADGVVLERRYEFGQLPRLQDQLAESRGDLRARFVFERLPAGRVGAYVSVAGKASLVCQRCMCSFGFTLKGEAKLEFSENPDATDSERELFKMQGGLLSLRELAEEEALLALPIAPACDTPLTCGNAPDYESGDKTAAPHEMRRPFSALQDLLKKT